ncbi:VOC family protein [Bacillus suaedaesalsae]|uniref:VOC family protein n=1 Tax=Bacillus suaedaesalsae TaxID=2810349 RepID=A0ABS2DGN7_9BACI|nr:VOC family protein [Bacillus suaedaesalsae]MBM6617620.1 VOC family protein [Bacillus suaedaesalsae]
MNIQIKRLDHVQVCIPFGTEEDARAFYTNILGFQEIEKPDSLKANGGLWYKVGDIELHIGAEEMNGYKSKRHPAFEVESLLEIRAYLEQHDIKIQDEKPIPNIERFTFFDPFGNRIEFLEKGVVA